MCPGQGAPGPRCCWAGVRASEVLGHQQRDLCLLLGWARWTAVSVTAVTVSVAHCMPRGAGCLDRWGRSHNQKCPWVVPEPAGLGWVRLEGPASPGSSHPEAQAWLGRTPAPSSILAVALRPVFACGHTSSLAPASPHLCGWGWRRGDRAGPPGLHIQSAEPPCTCGTAMRPQVLPPSLL